MRLLQLDEIDDRAEVIAETQIARRLTPEKPVQRTPLPLPAEILGLAPPFATRSDKPDVQVTRPVSDRANQRASQ
jgi:hypothetical protein